jgi:hypothetical protein
MTRERKLSNLYLWRDRLRPFSPGSVPRAGHSLINQRGASESWHRGSVDRDGARALKAHGATAPSGPLSPFQESEPREAWALGVTIAVQGVMLHPETLAHGGLYDGGHFALDPCQHIRRGHGVGFHQAHGVVAHAANDGAAKAPAGRNRPLAVVSEIGLSPLDTLAFRPEDGRKDSGLFSGRERFTRRDAPAQREGGGERKEKDVKLCHRFLFGCFPKNSNRGGYFRPRESGRLGKSHLQPWGTRIGSYRETPRIRPQARPVCATMPEGHPAWSGHL